MAVAHQKTYNFSILPDQVSARLRALANDIDQGIVHVQTMADGRKAITQEWEQESLELVFHRKHPEP